MNKKGFITIYILPLFLTMIVISEDILSSVTSSKRITDNFLGKEESKNLAYIGLKHGIKISKDIDRDEGYYVNLVDNSIKISDKPEDKYTEVNIRIDRYTEYKIQENKRIAINYKKIKVESQSNVNSYSHKEKYEYTMKIN